MRCFTKVLPVSCCLFFASLLGAPTANAADVSPAASAKATAVERYGDLPLSFEANQGQTDAQVHFVSRGSGYSFFLTQSGAVLSFSRDAHSDSVLRMQLAGANPNARIAGLDELPGKTNYFAGADSSRWRTGVPTYSRVKYENIYPGISLVYYGNQRQLEYDFVVAPAADPSQIRLSVDGAQKISVDAQGNLVLRNSAGELQLLAPIVYQQIDGQKKQISGQWTLAADNTAGFRLAAYDRSQPLVIDPVLMYSSFLGGSQKNVLSKIAVDDAGNAYVAGFTASGDFPATPTPMATTFGAGAQSRGAFVAKIDPTGSNLLYSTYLSGSADEEATGLAVDKSGNVYVAGTTHSPDFPTRNALQSTCATRTSAGTCSSAFLTKISPTGDSLLFSTYLGGSGGESARGLAVDAKGSAYLAGVTSSPDFPVTAGSVQAKCAGSCQQNAFVAKFSPSGDKLIYATYIGGSATDDAADLAVDPSGNAYLAGHTTSPDFPLATPYQKSCAADATSASKACVATAFVAKLTADGSAFEYSTYLGGKLGSQASAIAVDAKGSAYISGSTQSADFPVLKPFQKSCGLDAVSKACSVDVFLTKLTPTGNALVYSTYLGGTGRDEASGIAVDATGNVHIVGRTESADFPTIKPLQSHLKGTSDAFAARLNPAGDALTFSTYHGGTGTESGLGIALDAKGNIYLAGETTSADFPTHHPFQSSCAGACTSAFITKMSVPPPATAPTITSANSASFLGGAGAPASSFTVTTTGTLPITIDDAGVPTPAPGVTFTADPATGTATIAGTPTAATASTVTLNLTATNTTGTDTQTFTLSICPGTVTGVPALGAVNADGIATTTFNVNMSAGSCVWTSSSDQGWLTIAGGATGSGSGTFSVGSFTSAGAATTRTGNLFIVGSPFPVTQRAVDVALTSPATLVEVGQTATFNAVVTNVGIVANKAVTWSLAIAGVACSPGCGTLTGATALSVTYNAPASVDPANPPGPVTITATSNFDNTKSKSATFTLTDYTISSPVNASVTQGTTIHPTLTGAAFSADGYTGTLNIVCAVAPLPANHPTCAVPGSITIPGTLTTNANVSAPAAAPAGAYTLTFTATDANGVSHVATTTLTVGAAPALSVTKTAFGTFTQGATGVWNIVVSNGAGSDPTSSGLTVADTLATGYTLTSYSGTNWTCTGTGTANVSCTSTSTIAGGASYPMLTLNVSIPAASPVSISNTASASGGGALAPAQDTVTVPVVQVPANLTISGGGGQSVPIGNNFAAFSATVTDAGSVPIQNVPVTFTVQPAGGASCSFGGSTTNTPPNTNASGVATTNVACKANNQNGAYTIQASVATAGVAKPTLVATNTDFKPAFTPLAADVAPGAAPAGVTIKATALSGYAPTSLTVTGCVVTSTNPAGLTPVPTCTITSPVTVGTATPVTFSTTGSPAGTYNFQATLTDASLVPVSHPAPFTIHIVTVVVAPKPAVPIEVGQTATYTGTVTGLPADPSVNWTATCTGSCGTLNPTTTPDGATPTTYTSPSTPLANTTAETLPTVTITGTSNADATFSDNTGAFAVTDFAVVISASPIAVTQAATGTLQASAFPINTYSPATIPTATCAVSATSGFTGVPTCSTGALNVGTAPTPTAVSIPTGNAPVGLYTATVTGKDAVNVSHTASQMFSVQCQLTLGQVTPTLIPTQASGAVNYQVAIGVTESAGGSACPYGNFGGQPVVGGTQIPDASVTPVTGAGPAVSSLDPTQVNGTLAAVSANNPLTFNIVSPVAAGQSTITVPYFFFDPITLSKTTSSTMSVGLEPEAQGQVAANGSVINIPVTQAAAGTLKFVTFPVGGACVAVDVNGLLDPANNNFGITCAAAAVPAGSGTQIQLTLTIGASSAAAQRHQRRVAYALGTLALGFPAIVFLSVGVSAFAPVRRKRGFNRITILGIILLVFLLGILPACGGGFKFQFTNAAAFTLTGMAYVTDSSNNIVGVDVFTVPLTAN